MGERDVVRRVHNGEEKNNIETTWLTINRNEYSLSYYTQ
jgi:hypothetical protein